MENLIIFFKSLSEKTERLLNIILSLIYKEKCVICKKEIRKNSSCLKTDKILCKNCLKTVEILSGFPHTKFNGVEIYSTSFYEGTMKDLILKLKFNHKKDIAKVLAYFLFKYFYKLKAYKKECGDFSFLENIVAVPVPTNKSNIKRRGYNNVYEIVREFAALSKVSYSKNILLKIKNTKPQYKLGPKKRAENVSGSFSINLKEYKRFKGKTVLIIDDIYTTGATLNEVIKTFKKEEVNNIFCITLSKAV